MSEHNDYHDSGAEFPRDRLSNDRIEGDGSESGSDAWLSIQLLVKKDRPELLQGLEQWLELGLISPDQVKKIARNYLTCTLPVTELARVYRGVPSAAASKSEQTPVLAAGVNPVVQIMRSFLDELSIRWLLFLGIFLVVVSSGVLAASQWQNFSNYGQYLILLVYTLGFGGIGWWTSQKNSLKLTTQTLNAIATLLIPINFWAISHLRLSQSIGGYLLIAAAALVLMGATSYITHQRNRNYFWLVLFWLLSYLHLGWQIDNFPLPAIYGGIGALVCSYKWLSKSKYAVTRWLYVLTAWSLLLMRSIASSNPIADYCLAIAILAWLIGSIYLNRISQTKVVALKHKSAAINNSLLLRIPRILGIILFVSTWLISVNAGLFRSSLFFWQTVAISTLAIHLFNQRLRLYGYRRDLTAIFFIGLQILYVCKELIPDSFRNEALELSVAISKTAYLPESVLGVTLFPYVILFVLVASLALSSSKALSGSPRRIFNLNFGRWINLSQL